jgi:anti-sigma B factor antagonist
VLVTIDLRHLTFIDSCGIHELIKADAGARRSGRRLVIVRGTGQVDRVLTLVSLSEQVEMIDL